MTTPNGAILFNSSTGNDTTASGLGAANVYGSGASTTGSSAVVTGIDTTGVSSGDLLWVQSSSGRQFSIIATVDSSTQVTCDDVFANTESGRTWAIGGKRATLAASQRIYDDGSSSSDAHGDWIVELEDGYTETLSSSINLRVSATSSEGFIFRGADGASNKPVLTFSNSGDAISVYAQDTTIKNIELKNSATTTSAVIGIRLQNYSAGTKIIDVKIDDPVNNFYHAMYANGSVSGFSCDRCSIGNTANVGCYPRVVTGLSFSINRCSVFNCGSDGISHRNSPSFSVTNCVIFGNAGYGINVVNGQARIANNVIHNNSNGIELSNTLSPSRVVDNLITSCGTAISVNSGTVNGFHLIDGNAFYNNTTNVANYNRVTNSITLTADPFVDAAAGDFNLNADAGGGALLRANNYALNTDTSIYPFRQYVSDDFGGGGGSVFHPLA